MTLYPATNGHLTLDFDDSPEVLWEEVVAHLLTEGFVRKGIALAAGWDEWSGNYLLSHSDDGKSYRVK
jgi:hypothetical protein